MADQTKEIAGFAGYSLAQPIIIFTISLRDCRTKKVYIDLQNGEFTLSLLDIHAEVYA
jgi:hypothetical protein